MPRDFSQKILISSNSSCNLRCIYCFERNKENYEFDVDEAISFIGGILSNKTELGTKIKIWGGEPFLVFDKLRLLCETLWENNYDEYFQIHITTNGTLIHGEIQNWLNANRDKVILKLSIDGDKRSNDINRPNSFELIDIPFFVRTWPDIVASMTITPSTLPYLFENILFLHDSGFQNIVFQLSLLTDWSKYNLEHEYYKQVVKICDFYLQHPEYKTCFSWLEIEKTLYDNLVPLCGIGRMKAYDFQTKQYYPCQMCFPSACSGKLSTELQKINFIGTDFLADENCKTCPFVNVCVTCYAENYISRGATSRRDMKVCPYFKILFAVVFAYEYARIIKLDKPSRKDIEKMQAIQKWRDVVDIILKQFK